MRKLFILFFVPFMKKILFCNSQTIPNGKECSIYQVDNGHQVMFSKRNETRFNFGYLRVDKDTPPMETQVFIKFLNKDLKYSTQIEIYLNSERQIIIRDNVTKMAESTKYLKDLPSIPSWYYFQVILQDGKIKIKRPGRVTNIIKSKLPDRATKNFEVYIASKYTEYVTFNCLTKCPTFDHFKGNTIDIKLQTSFTINFLCSKHKTCFIKFSVSSTWFSGFNHTNYLSPGVEDALQFEVCPQDGVKKLQIILPDGEKNFTSKTNGTINYTLKIIEAQNLLWSFNCKPAKNYLLASTPHLHSGRSFPLSHSPSKQGKSHMTFRLGEVAAWIVASLSLCGLLIVGLTLYMKIARTEWPENGEKFDHGASVSHVGAVEMIPYPKNNKSTFYAEIRKPEETSGASSDRRSINVISDFLYPMDLDLSVDDDMGDGRLDSRDTVLTQITNVS